MPSKNPTNRQKQGSPFHFTWNCLRCQPEMQRPFGRCTTMFWRCTVIPGGGRAENCCGSVLSVLVMFMNMNKWRHCHLTLEQLCRTGNQEQLLKLQDFAAVKGDKRFQIKNTRELTNLMWQQWLCSAGCQPAPLSLCAPELKLFKMGLNLCLPLECFRLLT